MSAVLDSEYAAIKLPPHSVEAEQSVLGGLLLENSAWERVADLINERDFYRADHRTIWKQITRLIEENKPADVITVAESLDSFNQLGETGGLGLLDLARSEHAVGGKHPALCRDRPGALGAAPPGHGRYRNR